MPAGESARCTSRPSTTGRPRRPRSSRLDEDSTSGHCTTPWASNATARLDLSPFVALYSRSKMNTGWTRKRSKFAYLSACRVRPFKSVYRSGEECAAFLNSPRRSAKPAVAEWRQYLDCSFKMPSGSDLETYMREHL